MGDRIRRIFQSVKMSMGIKANRAARKRSGRDIFFTAEPELLSGVFPWIFVGEGKQVRGKTAENNNRPVSIHF
jgi:hypothetical protein